MTKVIGIDLGTSNSATAVSIGGKATMIPAAEGPGFGGAKAFPSIVAITKDGRSITGELARRQIVSNSEGIVIGPKRKMGTDFRFEVYGREYTPQQISAFILKKIKKDAEAFLGENVSRAVITVPAYFNDNQRQATKDAGEIADLDVIRIVNEPTAAALAYGLDKAKGNPNIMVFDLGGGTLDVVVMEIGEGVFQVKTVAGDTQLGGTDMDNILIDYVLGEFKKQSGLDMRNDKAAIMRIREAVEKAKIELSFVIDTEINLPFIAYDPSSGPRNLLQSLTRAKLEELVRPMVEKCGGPIMQALNDAKMKPDDIDKILLVGGPTRMPIVRGFVKRVMGKEPEQGVDPSDTVALGASIMGAILGGEVISSEIQLIDVTPLTLGVEVLDGKKEPIIERNNMVPIRKSKLFTTVADNQPIVTINVVQGESPIVAECVSLGKFDLSIPPASRGAPQIEVTFELDVNGILNVQARDLKTSREANVTIHTKNKLSKEEVEELKKVV